MKKPNEVDAAFEAELKAMERLRRAAKRVWCDPFDYGADDREFALVIAACQFAEAAHEHRRVRRNAWRRIKRRGPLEVA